jgi:hypothetical protein
MADEIEEFCRHLRNMKHPALEDIIIAYESMGELPEPAVVELVDWEWHFQKGGDPKIARGELIIFRFTGEISGFL